MMQNFAKRNGRAKALLMLQSIAGVLLLLGVTVLAARAAWGMYGKFVEAAQSDDVAQQQLSALTQQEAQVSSSVDSFATPRGVEAQVRERYGVVKPGEGQIQIVRTVPTSTAATVPAQNLFERAWQALFGWL